MADYHGIYQRIYWNGVLFSHRPCKLYGKYRLWYCDSGSRRDFDLYSYFDAITDPIFAFLYDKVNTRFGKVRILMISGWAIMVLALLMMYNWAAGKGRGTVTFILLYVLYIIGYTIFNMTVQTLYALMTNDPRQRPMIGVCSTILII